MTGRIARLSVAVAAGVSVLVSGCDSSGDPGSLPTASGSSSVSPSGSASASASPTAVPTPPAAAQKHTSAGASEFVRFYIGLINEAYRSGASEPLRAYADDECDSCASIADAVDEIYANGSTRGGQITIRDVTPTVIRTGVQPSVVVHTAKSAYQRLDRDGNIVETSPFAERVLIFHLTWDGAWTLAAIRTGQDGES